MNEKNLQDIETAVVNALGRGATDKRYIDTGRIPFICDDIRQIKEMMMDNNKTVGWAVKMIYLAMGGLTVLTVLILPLIFSIIQNGNKI